MSILNGAVVVDKPQGLTSHDVVDELRKIFGQREVGHTGTLDPLATGVMVCLLGEATKLSSYVTSDDKSYLVEAKLGVVTDSGDITGVVVSQSEAGAIEALTQARLEVEIKKLVGPLELAVPKFSALKKDGKKLYEYAHKGEDVIAPTKLMMIECAELKSFRPGFVEVEIHCGKGTFIRSWVEKLGSVLGVGATVNKLRRLSSGAFVLDQAVDLPTLKALSKDSMGQVIINLSAILESWPKLKVIGRDRNLLLNGQLPFGVERQLLSSGINTGVQLIDESSNLLALVDLSATPKLKILRVFKPQTGAIGC